MASTPNLVAFVENELKDADLDNLTAKDIRLRAEAHFGVPLESQKDVIKRVIQEYVAKLDEEPAAEEPEPAKKGSGLQKEMLLSEGLAALLGIESGKCARTMVTKKIWAYIKERNLQDPSDGRKILMDEPMQALFNRKTCTMFSINKLLSKHLYVDDASQVMVYGENIKEEPEEEYEEEEAEYEEEEEDRKPAKSKSKKNGAKKRKRESSGGGSSGIHAPLEISPALQQLVGAAELPRTEITSRLWAYIREHDLQNPDDKRQILWDALAREVFCVDSCTMFRMAKLVTAHVRSVGSDVPFGDPEALAAELAEADAQPKPKKKRKSPAKKGKKGSAGGGGGPTFELSDELYQSAARPS